MPKRQSRVRLTSTEAKGKFLERAEEWWEDFIAWHQADPRATFDEMETRLGQRRRQVLGEFVQLGLRQGDLGAEPEAPTCRKCGKPMAFQGYCPGQPWCSGLGRKRAMQRASSSV
jgi:hypothetical protein